MLQNIINFSINNKLIIGLFTFVLIAFGIYSVSQLPIDAVPDITNNQVQIITSVPSLGAPDVERLITFPIEQANANIPGLKEIRSFSRFGLSLVTVVFDDKTDVYWARQQVTERLQQVQSQLPQGIGIPTLAPVTTGLGEIYQYVIKPKKGFETKFNSTELRTIQDWIVRRQLLGVQGVADVSSFGGKLKQYEIAVNPEKLNAMQLTIADVFTALEKNNQNTGGAYIEKGPTIQFIRSEGLIQNIDDIKSIVVKNNPSGIPITINDVADVQFGSAIRYGAVCYNSDGEVAGAVVMMLKGENSSAVIKRVKERVEQIKKTLPEGVEIEPFLDRTKMVNNAIHTVENNLVEGALIVIFILVIFLGNIRAGLITASVIPLAMLFAIIMMNLFGVSGNLMSLGAIDFGLIVDGAVIIVEGVLHTLSSYQFSSGVNDTKVGIRKEIDNIVSSSAGRLMSASLFGQLIILIVYLPIFSLDGIEGKMFKPMAQTVTFALLGAFILSLTYIPMMTALLINKNKAGKVNISDRVMHQLENKFQILLEKLMKFPKAIMFTVFGLFVIAMFVMTQLGGEFIPALEEGDFAVDTRVMTGSNLNTTIEKTQLAAKTLLHHFPEVQKVVTKIGSGEIPTDPMPIEASDMMVILKPKKEWTSAKTFDELSEKMSKKLEEIPGITAGFQYPVQMRFNELMTGARQDVVCKIFGENLDTLAHYAEKLGKVIGTVSGTENLYIEPIEGLPQIVIHYNRPLIAQYGLNIDEINKTVNTAFAGQSAGQIFEGEKRFDLVVRLQNNARKDIKDIANLLITTPSGNQIPLNQVASVELVNSANQIQREDAKRRVVVGFNVGDRDVQSIVNELQEKVDKQIKLPTGYYVNYGGAFENLQQAKNRLMIAVPVALLLIFLLLYFAFGSVKQGLLVYSAIPLSAIGGILLLAARGMPFSISAGIGFIALFGVAVLNGIVLINEFNRLKETSDDSIYDIVIKGTKSRLRPVLMTACVASLGFIPMALSNGAGAEVQRPLATVVIGGLMTATFLTLFVLPVLFVWFEHKKTKDFTIKNIKVKKITSVIIILLTCTILQAQEKIALSNAIDLAIKNQYSLQAIQKNKDYFNQLKSTAKEMPKTNVSIEFGQFNSNKFDTKISVNQTIPFPKVFQAQQAVYEAQANKLNSESKWTAIEIKAQVKNVFYEYLILTEKEKLLSNAKTLFENYYQKSKLRFEKGESDVLEKISAESQLKEVEIQINELLQQKKQLIISFNYLLNDSQKYAPFDEGLKMHFENQTNVMTAQHPLLESFENEKTVLGALQQAEQTKLLPELTIGVNNQSIIGWQKIRNNEQYFNATKRFASGVVGFNIPIFQKSIKGKVKSFSYLMDQNELLKQQKEKELNQQFDLLQQEIISKNETIESYEKALLKNAKTIEKTANLQLNNGEIDYFKWVVLIHQSIAIQSDYLQQIYQLNHAIIQIQKLQNN
jgi:cobalt-zinc-cadmium resistance protein CzcA